jgi:hypothetical protein
LKKGRMNSVWAGRFVGERDETGGGHADQRLPEELDPRRHALRVPLDHLPVVVHPADRSEREHHPHHDPHEPVARIGPQGDRDRDRSQDKRAAHGRRSRLDEMRLRTVVAHRLPDLVRGQAPDHARADDERDDERGQAGEHRSQRDVAEHVERADVLRQILGKL